MRRNYSWQFRDIFLFLEGALESSANCGVLAIKIMILAPHIIFDGLGA